MATERTEAGDQHIIPGAEADQGRSEAARRADQRRLLEARQRQSKMRSSAPQTDAGPLFDTQEELF